ncbi:hypothetical protein ABH999_007123 [Bradyrhizobium yuanmingense]
MTETTRKTGVSRRTLLKGTAGLAGLAAGSGAITGFPSVKSADAKVLRYLGTAVNEGDRHRQAMPEGHWYQDRIHHRNHGRRHQARDDPAEFLRRA